MRSRLPAAMWLLLALSCAKSATPDEPDAGTPDAGMPDAGTPDAGTPDAGMPDAGMPDAGMPDAGTPDAGTPDAGTPDAGTPDVAPDAGPANPPLTFYGASATPALARDGTAVTIAATASGTLDLSAGVSLTVGGRAATVAATSGNRRVVFSFTAARGLDVEGDQPLVFSGRLASGASGSTAFHGSFAIDFDPFPDAGPKVSVLTQHVDPQRSGANLAEQELTPGDVNSQEFGKLFSRPVDGMTLAQPLVVSGLALDGGTVDGLLVATEHDSVYLFDAVDPAASAPLWQVTLGTPVPPGDVDPTCDDLWPEIGITGTPAIDPETRTVYLAAKSKDGAGQAHYRLHALDLATGNERPGSPVEIAAVYQQSGGVAAHFDPLRNNQRAAVLLTNGVVYLAFASHCDVTPYHGWILAYDAATLAQVAVWDATPTGSEGGIWQGGNGPSVDDTGAIYATVGNGTFSAASRNRGNSAVKFAPPSGGLLQLADSFTPRDQDALNAADLDFGSMGPVLLPGTNLLATGGKSGIFFVLSRSALGGFATDANHVVQELPATKGAIFGSPVLWRGAGGGAGLLYVWTGADIARSFSFSDSGLTAASTGRITLGRAQGAQLALSASGATGGILWTVYALRDGAPPGPAFGMVRAFDAADLSRELWNSEQNSARDSLGTFAKFNSPTVANGRVYLGTSSGAIVAYGLLR